MGAGSACPSLVMQRSALAVSKCLEGRGGWLAEWETAQRAAGQRRDDRHAVPPSDPASTFSLLRGWEDVERWSAPRMRKFDESSCLEWDLASLVDTEEASMEPWVIPEVTRTIP